jgi:hypothetical protein
MLRASLRVQGLLLLAMLVATLLGATVEADHDHHDAGLHDTDCPLAALVALERQEATATTPAWSAFTAVTGPWVGPASAGYTAVPASDLRSRAPPLR